MIPESRKLADPRKARRFVPLMLSLLCVTILGCGDAEPSAEVIEARRLLQSRKVQDALDVLKAEETAEGHFLKALSLHYLIMPDAAREQIGLALESNAENVKYQGFQLRISLPEAKTEAADKLIELYKQNPSSAAAALFAFWAHGTKRLAFRAQKQMDRAKRSGKAALSALKTSIKLSAEVPELQREMFELAIEFGLREEIELLVIKLRKAAPDDPELLMANPAHDAPEQAREYYLKNDRSQKAAMLYAKVLAKSKANSKRDRHFQNTFEKYRRNPDIATWYATYLAKSNRLTRCGEVLETAIEKQTNKAARLHLKRTAILLPLERGDANSAQQQLERYGTDLNDPLLFKFFEGRLLFLRNQHNDAIKKMNLVIRAQKGVPGSSRDLAVEALKWIKAIMADQAVSRQLEKATKAVESKDAVGESADSKTVAPKQEKSPIKPPTK